MTLLCCLFLVQALLLHPCLPACSQSHLATFRCSSRLTPPGTLGKLQLQHGTSMCSASSKLSACRHAQDCTKCSWAARC